MQRGCVVSPFPLNGMEVRNFYIADGREEMPWRGRTNSLPREKVFPRDEK